MGIFLINPASTLRQLYLAIQASKGKLAEQDKRKMLWLLFLSYWFGHPLVLFPGIVLIGIYLFSAPYGDAVAKIIILLMGMYGWMLLAIALNFAVYMFISKWLKRSLGINEKHKTVGEEVELILERLCN